MLSPSLEDYLEEIYRLSLSAGTVRVTDISRKLRVSTPSVTKALRRLISKGYITHQRYGLIGVTESGKKMGTFLIERNQTLQEFLMLIRANCDIPAEAESIEHYLSNSTIDSLKSLGLFMQSNPDVYKRYLGFTGVVEQADIPATDEQAKTDDADQQENAETSDSTIESDRQETDEVSDTATEPETDN
ncbi:Fur family transcriptional regulator [Sporomusaceae bacterium FL31]|nr:Fur family transcriptional regulator [Sporomusaceae bacterium FL31]GCE34014.1 Fur family transcriptional regulator [Sporomusaceae bacterium]